MKIPLLSPRTELWHVGIAHTPAAALLEGKTLSAAQITWLPLPPSFCFLADPFGVWREGGLCVYAEALDYRSKRGEIHYYRFDAQWNLISSGVALRKPFHLSYPFLIEDNGALYMLPEAHKSGALTLYRCTRFPDQWEEVASLLNQPTIDASIIYHQQRWWMFYALPGENSRAMRELYLASAESLTGRWTPHPMSPVRTGLDASRPGGTPFIHRGELYLPTQDCQTQYGGALNLLRITALTPDRFVCEPALHITADGLHPDYTQGIHTLAACGDVTLFDVKRVSHSPARLLVNLKRRFNRICPQH